MKDQNMARVYAQVDERGRVTRLEGEYTLPQELTGWVLVEEGEACDRLNLAQSQYLPGGLRTEDDLPRWKIEGSTLLLRSDAELAQDRAARPAAVSRMDRLEAQAAYTAMMTDTLTEG